MVPLTRWYRRAKGVEVEDGCHRQNSFSSLYFKKKFSRQPARARGFRSLKKNKLFFRFFSFCSCVFIFFLSRETEHSNVYIILCCFYTRIITAFYTT